MSVLFALSVTVSLACFFMDCWLFDAPVREWAEEHEAWLCLGAYSPLLIGCASCVLAFFEGVSIEAKNDLFPWRRRKGGRHD